MKSTTEIHREALDQALRVALGTSQTALKKQALTRAATHLIHPKLVLESPLLTESHGWHQEALLVSDAFEAVTNGMAEGDLLEDLLELAPDSPFFAWGQVILAIHFFYEGLDEAVRSHLAAIPDQSPVRVLARTLEALISGTASRLPPALRRLADQVALPDPQVSQWVQDISEGLETEDEDLFWSALTCWLEHLNPSAPDRARSAVLWAWNQLEWRDFDEAVLIDLSASLWGRAEAYRLAAVGSLPWDPEGSSLLWARFMVQASREGSWEPQAMEEARHLLDRFHRAAEEVGPLSPEAQSTWTALMAAWNSEIGGHHPEWTWNTGTPPPALVSPSSDGQLDLFS